MQNPWPARVSGPISPHPLRGATRILARMAMAVVLLGGSACASRTPPKVPLSSWQEQMRAGVESAEAGDDASAVEAFGSAVLLARLEPGHPDQLAYASWHLGDVCFRSPQLCPPGEDERETQRSYDLFAAHYGPEHPVVIPILLRLSELRARAGDTQAAQALLEESDEITARTFPKSHFMRAGAGSYRPAASLHPQEILQILSELDTLGG